jgi:hypothetical protein
MSDVFCLRQLVPNLKIANGSVTMPLSEFRALASFAAMHVKLDEQWYVSNYPDVAAAVKARRTTGSRHFIDDGFFEGRLAISPQVDEEWYLSTYKDVAEAVRTGRIKSAWHHYTSDGVREGRLAKRTGK